jgi:hypothetical protein
VLLARLRAAHRATAGDTVRAHAAARGGRVDLPMKSRATESDVGPERTAPERRKPLIESRILESPHRNRDLNVHGRQSNPRFHLNANMAIMRIWSKWRISVLAAETDLSDARVLPMSAFGTKQTYLTRRRMSASSGKTTLTNRCLPISIYEYTP